MAMGNFDKCLTRTLVHEGGWSNHPKDPGGATMRGVIQRVYDGYRDRKGLGRRSVRQITDDELKEIYRRQYWDQIRGDELPAGIDAVVFDGAVNSGPGQSAKWLQRALGVGADGHIGDATIGAANYHSNHDELVEGICEQRMTFLRQLRTWGTFGRGWTGRVNDIRNFGLALASGPNAVAVMPDASEAYDVLHGKAPPEPPKSSMIESKIGNGAAIGGGLGALETARQVSEVASSSRGIFDMLSKLVLNPTFIIVVAFICVAGYIWWDRHRKMKAENT